VIARRRSLVGVLALSVVVLGACAPKLPAGVEKARLEAAIDGAIGDANTCVLIAPARSTNVAYRYNSHTICARTLPSCAGGQQSAADLLAAVARDGQPRATSCHSTPDGARDVAWAAGPVPGRPLVYAAVMEGERAMPGRIMTERLAGAFKDAGL